MYDAVAMYEEFTYISSTFYTREGIAGQLHYSTGLQQGSTSGGADLSRQRERDQWLYCQTHSKHLWYSMGRTWCSLHSDNEYTHIHIK